MKKTFRVNLEKQSLIFSAAHFITFGDNVCESLHGHNYRVACQVVGELDEHACVIDFIWLRDKLQELTKSLDHKVLLPDRHPTINVVMNDDHYETTFQQRRWVFPAQDVALLPVDNTTAERLAEYLAQQIRKKLEMVDGLTLKSCGIGVDENEGQWAWCEVQF